MFLLTPFLAVVNDSGVYLPVRSGFLLFALQKWADIFLTLILLTLSF
jgi:hypothetical protein